MTAAELRAALARHGLNQVGFAKAYGVTEVTVSRWCTGVRPIPLPVEKFIERMDTKEKV